MEDSTKTLSKVIRIDESEIRGHLDEMVRGTVEETLNAMLDAEADEMCNASATSTHRTASILGPVLTSASSRPKPAKSKSTWPSCASRLSRPLLYNATGAGIFPSKRRSSRCTWRASQSVG